MLAENWGRRKRPSRNCRVQAAAMKNLTASARQGISMPLLPRPPECITQSTDCPKAGLPQPGRQKGHKRGQPEGPTAEEGWHRGLGGGCNQRATPHPEPRLRTDLSDHEHRPSPQFEGSCRAAPATNGKNTPPHTCPGEAAHMPLDQDHAPAKAVLAAGQGGRGVVTSAAGDEHCAAAQLSSEPVAGIAADAEPSSGHFLSGMATGRVSDHHLAPLHAGGQPVHPREVTAALDATVVGCAPHGTHVTKRAGPFVSQNVPVSNLGRGQPGQSVRRDAGEVDCQRPVAGCSHMAGRAIEDERHLPDQERRRKRPGLRA